MAMFNQTNKMDPIELFKWFEERKASAATPEGRKSNALGSKPGDVGTGELSPVEDYFASLWEKTQQSVEATRKELAPTMEEAARRSAEEAATLRSKMGITDSDFSFGSRIAEMQKRKQNISMLKEPEPYEGKGLMAPPLSQASPDSGDLVVEPLLTAQQRNAVSMKGDGVIESMGYGIVDEQGSFSNEKLKDAVFKSINNPIKRSLIMGIVDVEVGDKGPIEEASYSRKNVASMSPTSTWGKRLVRDGILTPSGAVTDKYSGANVFNSIYADRLGNGDFASGDGNRYKGRGIFQLTGKDTYREVQKRLRANGIEVDLLSNPELALDNRYALPAALAYLDYKGLDDIKSEGMTAKGLNNLINSGAGRETAEQRWAFVVNNLRASGKDEEADEMALRNEYAAQEKAGAKANGLIDKDSASKLRQYLKNRSITVPKNASTLDLVKLVNASPIAPEKAPLPIARPTKEEE
jgi:putative chitinase